MVVLYLYRYFTSGVIRQIHGFDFGVLIVPIILGTFFYKLQRSRLKFTVIPTDRTRAEFDDVIAEVAAKHKWTLVTSNDRIVVAKTGFSWAGSWGEQITILFDKDRILINSICDPDKRSSVTSFGRNKKNVRALKEEID